MEGEQFFRRYLFKLAKTGHPWLTFKDEHNRHNTCPNYSVINSSNLCTEISIPNRHDSTAVCTLASLNLSKHLNGDQSDLDWVKICETLETMVLALDNIQDRNFYPSEETRQNTFDLRPLGIGIMAFAEALVTLGIAYHSDEAVALSRKLCAFMREVFYGSSERLAEEGVAFGHYEEADYDYKPRRNAVLLAIAPTATISIICGTTSSIDSYFSNLYSRDTLSGKHIVIKPHLVHDLESRGLWSEEMANHIKQHNGSVQQIRELDGKSDKELYKSAYEIHPKRQIDIAAAFQESVDQAVSKSLYIDERFREEMSEIYLYAWKSRLKSTYYCFIDKVIKGEKYTSKVNKRGSRRGFGASVSSGSSGSPGSPGSSGSAVSSASSGSSGSPGSSVSSASSVDAADSTVEGSNGASDESVVSSIASIAVSGSSAEPDQEALIREAREKFGDAAVEEALTADADSCPVDPMLRAICPACE